MIVLFTNKRVTMASFSTMSRKCFKVTFTVKLNPSVRLRVLTGDSI